MISHTHWAGMRGYALLFQYEHDDNLTTLCPSRLSTLHSDGNEVCSQVEGAKKLWIETGLTWALVISTLDLRSIGINDGPVGMKLEEENISWDATGITKVRRKGTTLSTSRKVSLQPRSMHWTLGN